MEITAGKQYLGTKGRQYVTIKNLEKGGQGVVWLAKDGSKNDVVLKFPHKTTQEHENMIFQKSIIREIGLLEKMVNPPPSIIRYIDKSADMENEPFLVVEYLEGKTLYDLVQHSDNGRGRDQCLSEKVAVEYAKQIGEGLHYLHNKASPDGQPIAHRDLKAENIFVTKRGCVIIDLGVGKGDFNENPPSKGKKSTVNRIKRDERFHCPIHYEGVAWEANALCDIYAAARITFFMLTGDTEINELEDKQTHEITRKVHDIVPSVSEKFSNIISDALDPQHRYVQIAKDESGNSRGWVNKIEYVISDLSSQATQHDYSPREAVSKKLPPADILQPHIICMGKRWDIENGLCEIGREHNCPTHQPEFLFEDIPNTDGCARDVIDKSQPIDADGFSYPHPLSGKVSSPDISIKNEKIDFHHLRIWKDKKSGKFCVKDLKSRNKSARIVNGRWKPLNGLMKQELNDIDRLAVGFHPKTGPVIQLSFYKE